MGATQLLLASTALSAGAGLSNAISQSNAARDRGRYQQQIAESNARISDIQAEDALARGDFEARKIRRNARRLAGAQRAAAAGQGLDVNSGTAADLQDETGSLAELDAITIRNNAYREAWGYRSQASQYRYQGKFDRIAAKHEARNTLLTGGLRFAGDVTTGAYLYNQDGRRAYTPKNQTEARFNSAYLSRPRR